MAESESYIYFSSPRRQVLIASRGAATAEKGRDLRNRLQCTVILAMKMANLMLLKATAVMKKELVCWFGMGVVALCVANAAFAAPALRSVVIESQSPASATPGGLVYFPFSVTRTGSGSLSAYLSVSGLPSGATFSFYPPELTFDEGGPSTKSAILLIRLDPLTPAGEYMITISAQKGNSPEILSTSTTLSVSGTPIVLMAPVLDVPVLNSDGTVGLSGLGVPVQPVLVQATTNLAVPSSWVTIAVQTVDERGLFSLVDLDRTNYPARFYRAAH